MIDINTKKRGRFDFDQIPIPGCCHDFQVAVWRAPSDATEADSRIDCRRMRSGSGVAAPHGRMRGSGPRGSHQLGKTPSRPLPASFFEVIEHFRLLEWFDCRGSPEHLADFARATSPARPSPRVIAQRPSRHTWLRAGHNHQVGVRRGAFDGSSSRQKPSASCAARSE